MSKRTQPFQRPLADQEIFQQAMQKAGWYLYSYNNMQEVQKDLWKRAAGGAFFAGPFVGLGGVMGLIDLGMVQLALSLLALNVMICFAFPLKFHFYSRKLGREQQVQWKDYACFLNYLFLGWVGFFGSGMMLLFILSAFVWHHYSGWEVYVVGYLGVGIVLWWKRMTFLRAIAKPEAYSWVRLLLSISVGTGVLFSALARIFLDIVGRAISPTFSFMIAMTLLLSISLLLLGASLVAWILACLYYQKWRGVKELRV